MLGPTADPSGPKSDRPPPTPRWVWVLGIIAGVMILVVVILHATGRGLGSHMHR